MSDVLLTCEQAIFTSIRAPMGEGYRIVAAGAGLRAEERQAITKFPPSHDALCATPAVPRDARPAVRASIARASTAPSSPAHAGLTGSPSWSSASATVAVAERPRAFQSSKSDADLAGGFAFYSLPTGRLCAALTVLAGAEHTGRGGQRVYTHNLIFDAAEFARCAFNPFHLHRAMLNAGLSQPMLKPPAVLPPLSLRVSIHDRRGVCVRLHPQLDSSVRQHVLARLLEDGSIILDSDEQWMESAEALILGIPGPMRERISFSVGLSYSMGRKHRLHLLRDASGTAKTRSAGQHVEYINPRGFSSPAPRASQWVRFVDRLWRDGDFPTLDQRTSRPFLDLTPATRERMAALYETIDSVGSNDAGALLSMARHYLEDPGPPIERDIVDHLLDAVQRDLGRKLADLSAAETRQPWKILINLWGSDPASARFAAPVIESALTRTMQRNPVAAAKAAADAARRAGARTGDERVTRTVDRVLEHLAEWCEKQTPSPIEPVLEVCDQWRMMRPDSPMVARIRERCLKLMNHHEG